MQSLPTPPSAPGDPPYLVNLTPKDLLITAPELDRDSGAQGDVPGGTFSYVHCLFPSLNVLLQSRHTPTSAGIGLREAVGAASHR